MEENAVPNPRTYTTMIEHLVSSGKLDSAIEVFHILPRMRIKRSSRMYTALLKGFMDARRFEVVSDLRNEMQIDGVFLPLRQCSHEEGEDDDDDEDGGDVELASKIKFEPEILSALDDTNMTWTSVLVCKILWRMLPDNSIEDIWAFYRWLGNKPGRFTHDAYTASTMLKILTLWWGRNDFLREKEKEKRFRDYWDGELIRKIKEDGISLSYVTLNYIIDRRTVQGVLRLFRRAEEICHPLSKFHLMILYSSLMRRVTHKQYVDFRGPFDFRGPLDFLDEMILRGILPDIPTFTGLMQYFSVRKDLRTVLKLFRMVRLNNLKPDAFMFQILIRAYLRRGKVELAFKAFQDMRDSNFMPDSATKALLVKHLSKEGMSEEVTVVEAGSEEINHLPPLPLHGYIWNVSSFDLKRVYDIYFDSFRATTS
jgi:pentatricopeptide repeat protein